MEASDSETQQPGLKLPDYQTGEAERGRKTKAQLLPAFAEYAH